MEQLTKQDLMEMAQHILHEMGSRFDEVNAKLASMDARLKLQAGFIQAGTRTLARFSQFAEDSESRWIAHEARLTALEKKPEGGKT
jgi:hypothetical protein